MSRHKPKTQGFEWLVYSINSFNGNGSPDRKSPERYLDSYISYKTRYKDANAVLLANKYYHALIPLAEHLIANYKGDNFIRSLINSQVRNERNDYNF